VLVHFFIDRPIFSSVISIIITLVGALCLVSLPIAQYPEITPPSVMVTATYNGANASVMEETVAAPIEEQVNGAEDMLYMNSISSNNGAYSLTVTFDIGTDLDIATVDVQNRVGLAQPQLPADVISNGISVKKQSSTILMVMNLTSPDDSRDSLFLDNYAKINIADVLARVPGVGNVTVFGDKDYSMRVWLNPQKMSKLGLTVGDIAQSIQEQNIQAPAGQIGQPPTKNKLEFQYSVQVKGRLEDPREFENIILRTNSDGTYLRLKDVARVEVGAKSYSNFTRKTNKDCTSILIYQLPDANALDVSERVRATMKELATYFPEGVEYSIPHDSTDFVMTSIDEVMLTLYEAMFLVFLIIFIFLQSWRATIIPMVTVPVSLIGTFIMFQVLGFSINTLTLFALVLAIGLVVDDAIVVVEAVQRHIDEDNMEPKAAAKLAMSEVTSPIIATSLVLIAVFVPVAFMGGITGRLYQQFALTLSVSVGFSTINALTLSPALSALLLHKTKEGHGPLGKFYMAFNRVFDKVTKHYVAAVRKTVSKLPIVIVFMTIVCILCFMLIKVLPTGFVPEEDQGYFVISVMMPEGTSLERNDQFMQKVEKYLTKADGIREFVTLGGMNILTGGTSSYTSAMFVMLTDWSERDSDELALSSIMAKAQQYFMTLGDGLAICFNPPPINGLGVTGGFQYEFQDRAGRGITEMEEAAKLFMQKAGQNPDLGRLSTTFSNTVPQIKLDLNRDKAKNLQVPIDSVFQALQAFLGGYYVNDYNKYGRTYRVMLQAESQYREQPQDINEFYVRTASADMLPLGTLVEIHKITGPEYIQRYNMYRTIEINGGPAPGKSSGQALAAMAKESTSLAQGYGYDWTGMAYQEILSGSQAGFIFALAFIACTLFLAAQYESWTIPFAVILAIPLGVMGAMLFQFARGLENNVYAQIGLVMLIGLVAKNAILIVEFAKMRYESGDVNATEAAVEAAHLRFRPILMTAFSFILGVLPLVIASGAGAASRHSLGTSVFGGMLIATVCGCFVTPALYVIFNRLGEWGSKKIKREKVKKA